MIAPFPGPVVVIGADSPIGLTIIRELGEHGLDVVALGEYETSLGRYSRYAARYEVLDAPLAEFLPGLVAGHGVSAIFAVSDSHLIELAQLKGTLGDCQVLCPDPEKLSIVLDKERTLDIAAGLGISVPPFWIPQPTDDFAELTQGLIYPVAIKWKNPEEMHPLLEAHGVAFEKVEYAASPEELLQILERYHPMGVWPMVQYRCPEYGLGQMLHMHDGKATIRFQHRRIREWPPTGGVSSFCGAIALDLHQEQMERSEKLLQAIGWEGPAMVEYRHDPQTGQYWLMEINGRFWGSLPLAYHCGVHFAWETFRTQVLAADVHPQGPYPLRKARYLIPDTKHLVRVVTGREWPLREKLSTSLAFAAAFFAPSVRYYVGSFRDLGPLLADIRHIIVKALRLGKPRRAE